MSQVANDHLAVLFSFRYTSGQDSANSASANADSAGVILAVHYNL